MISSASKSSPLVVVLTGGIASGKTAVSNLFLERDVPVIDTDEIARALVQPGRPVLDEIKSEFGKEFFQKDGSLNRKRMRTAIINDLCSKRKLETILHPAISKVVNEDIKAINAPYCLLVVPLFVESKNYLWADRVLTIDVNEKMQIDRLMARDHVTLSAAKLTLNAQASRRERLAVADDVIQNEGSFDELEKQVELLHKMYLTLASARDE